MSKIHEALKTSNGKLIYTAMLEQGESKLTVSIESGKVYFNSNSYSFHDAKTFDMSVEANRVAKEIFLSQLQVDIKRRLLELKQLELILEELGLKNIIRKTIVENTTMLLETKDEIIKESIKHTDKVIDDKVRPIALKKKKPVKKTQKPKKSVLANVEEE